MLHAQKAGAIACIVQDNNDSEELVTMAGREDEEMPVELTVTPPLLLFASLPCSLPGLPAPPDEGACNGLTRLRSLQIPAVFISRKVGQLLLAGAEGPQPKHATLNATGEISVPTSPGNFGRPSKINGHMQTIY